MTKYLLILQIALFATFSHAKKYDPLDSIIGQIRLIAMKENEDISFITFEKTICNNKPCLIMKTGTKRGCSYARHHFGRYVKREHKEVESKTVYLDEESNKYISCDFKAPTTSPYPAPHIPAPDRPEWNEKTLKTETWYMWRVASSFYFISERICSAISRESEDYKYCYQDKYYVPFAKNAIQCYEKYAYRYETLDCVCADEFKENVTCKYMFYHKENG